MTWTVLDVDHRTFASNISNTVKDTMLDTMEVRQETTNWLLIGTMTCDLGWPWTLLPRSTLEPLQRVQNAAAWLVFDLGRFDHVTPSLIQLHWLPVIYRVKFKLCCIIHAIHHDRSPTYLTETLQAVGATELVPGSGHPPLHRWTTPYHGCARSSVSVRSLTQVRPPGSATRAHPHRGWSSQFPKTVKIHYFTIAFSVC